MFMSFWSRCCALPQLHLISFYYRESFWDNVKDLVVDFDLHAQAATELTQEEWDLLSLATHLHHNSMCLVCLAANLPPPPNRLCSRPCHFARRFLPRWSVRRWSWSGSGRRWRHPPGPAPNCDRGWAFPGDGCSFQTSKPCLHLAIVIADARPEVDTGWGSIDFKTFHWATYVVAKLMPTTIKLFFFGFVWEDSHFCLLAHHQVSDFAHRLWSLFTGGVAIGVAWLSTLTWISEDVFWSDDRL